jgi:hypothetical protein
MRFTRRGPTFPIDLVAFGNANDRNKPVSR